MDRKLNTVPRLGVRVLEPQQDHGHLPEAPASHPMSGNLRLLTEEMMRWHEGRLKAQPKRSLEGHYSCLTFGQPPS